MFWDFFILQNLDIFKLSAGSSGGSDGRENARKAEDRLKSLGGEDPLEKGMATHSSILAGELHEQRWAIVRAWSREQLDSTERLTLLTIFR